ncbi:hypothetical protein ALNOE001_03230 [Candidatus Methanobinarius endosymbioticus]|uniref:Uncharacterized protein n=1 Tax=Candidatus Methanobinarius endosymbioticus TaxID=2006182 RepID=A0A366MD87_9EURY|nr:hypothetical protein ALNOE001_03230 [Candidatus Methanobinarius endosymbioticus]
MRDYNFDLISVDKIKINDLDTIDFLAGTDDGPQMRYVILRREGKEYHFIFTTLTSFENTKYYVDTLLNSLKFKD